MKEFKREERYMVVKLSKLADDQGEKMSRSEEIYRIAHFGKALVESVVIESDWPEYATVWEMVEDRVMGNPTPDHTNCHANGRKQAEQIDALQSELTKARELLTKGSHYGPHPWNQQVMDFLSGGDRHE